MKRRAFKALLFLLTGIVINVGAIAAISFYLSRGYWASVVYNVEMVEAKDAIILQRTRQNGGTRNAYAQFEARGFGWKIRSADTFGQPPHPSKGVLYLRVFDAGWPMLALQGEWRNGYVEGWSEGYRSAWGRTRMTTNGREQNMMPLLPLWPGFAINTIFYAAVLWLLFAAPGTIRRRIRIKRGQCASCGYSLRGTSGGTCPECGATA